MLAVGAQPPVSPCRPRPQPVSSKRMDPGRQPQGAGQAPADFADLLSSDDLQLRVDSFRKLGYSAREAQAVLLKLGLDAETDTVLGELIRTGAGTSSLWEREGRAASPPRVPGPGLVSRGGSLRCSPGTSASPPPSQEGDGDPESLLRPIVIDGSNVAMSHGNKEIFSCQGIQLAVKYFLERGHSDITVFVPSWRKQQPRPDVPIADQHILRELEKKKILVFTPSRRVGGKRVVCYDDRFIVKLAHEVDGIIVSNDTYRDLQGERSEWKRFIEERLLMYSFVNDKFMPPDDPLGRHGPSLDNFLRKKPQVSEQRHQPCPYGKKCTYGMKCKFYHPERANQSQRSLADELRENAKLSTLKESRQPRKGSQPETGHTPNASSLSEELERGLSLDVPPSPAKGQQVSENVPLYWRGCPWSARTGPPHPSSVDSSLELLDSGLGSYDGQHVEAPRSHSGLYGTEFPPPQCPSRISRQRCPPPGSQEGYQRCSCCSHVALTAGIQQYGHDPNPDFAALCHSGYSAYSGRLYEPIGQAYSLPSSFQSGRVIQDEYWHLQARSNNSLPNPYQVPSQTVRPHLGAYGDGWAQPHQAAFNVEREEVRKKLHAIFNPDHVDKVMDMFPQLLDPQRLAAKIISLKSYSGIS